MGKPTKIEEFLSFGGDLYIEETMIRYRRHERMEPYKHGA
jgi:hypothetical protein